MQKDSSKKVSWKIGGEAGFGIKGAGEILAKTFTRSGYFVCGYSEYPSLIRGGHNTYQATISSAQNQSNSEKIDILIALNKETIELHNHELSNGGIVFYDTPSAKEKEKDFERVEGVEYINIPFASIAKEKGGLELVRNTVALGATMELIGAEWDTFEKLINETYGKKGSEIVDMNIKAAKAGKEYFKKQNKQTQFDSFIKIPGTPDRLLMTGNDAVAMGAIAGGLQMYVAYPMTPATSVLHTLAALQEELGIVVKHAEDEIGVINMAIGASFAGVRSMVGTSGGGLALMGEGLGLTCITETPLVIFEAMRPGPATGLPTWTDQGDLRFLMHVEQGEGERIILTPGDLDEAFTLTAQAFYLAEKYQLPVFVLSDKYLGESHFTSEIFEGYFDNERQSFLEKTDEKELWFKRYEITDSGVSKRTVPGQPGGVHIANSDEHDEYGFSDETSKNRVAQVDKRDRKLEGIKRELPEPIIYGQQEADITLLGWGSTKGSMLDAIELLADEGIVANAMHLPYILPFPKEKVAEEISRANLVLLVENNASAQLAGIIKEHTGRPIDHKLLKYDGRPFWPEEIVREVEVILKMKS